MKRKSMAGLFCIALVGLLFGAAHAQTAGEIQKKMVDAQGGPEALKSVQDLTITGSIDLVQQGMSGTLTVYKKEPDKRRTDIEVMSMIITQCYDGKTAWWTNPQTGNKEVVSGDQAEDLKRQSMPIGASLDPAKYGLSYVSKGKEALEGKEYLVLEETYPDGLKVTIYVDPQTYLIHKLKSKLLSGGVSYDFEQILSDYKKEGPMAMAHSIVTYQNGAEYSKITFKEFKINAGIADSIFEMGK
jgi:outer membrane lipoprotein-sorting protein